ncbi:effector binding domain-containing protein [Alkalihalobacillus sp. 1P02AB]|uniref:effector binding domain-containing protein n=1 Tax=Alkalihalobacillus sp. 1P02AB TaxID=3132260 RepID=UPI0039A46F2A
MDAKFKLTPFLQCQLVEREYLLVGISTTTLFPNGFPTEAKKIQHQFLKRKDDVQAVKDNTTLISPFLCNEVLATYFACFEVRESVPQPEDMLEIPLKKTKYAMITCTNKTISEGYERLFQWMHKVRLQQKLIGATQLEIFYLEEGEEEVKVELLIPV